MELILFNINDLTQDEYTKWYSMMTAQRKEKVDKLRIAQKKYCTVAGEMIVKKYISNKLGIDYKHIIILTTEKGKPYVENINIHFNISHCENMVACAFDEKEIGVDIEKIRPINLSITKKVCTDNELLYIFEKTPQPDDFSLCERKDLLEKFFQIWTTKEAYFKCVGTGITQLKSIDCFKLDCNKTTKTVGDYIVQTITF